MPRHAERQETCRRKGRMKPIVMPSARTACLSAHSRLTLLQLVVATCGGAGGLLLMTCYRRAQIVEPAQSAWRKRQRYQLHQTGEQRLWACSPDSS